MTRRCGKEQYGECQEKTQTGSQLLFYKKVKYYYLLLNEEKLEINNKSHSPLEFIVYKYSLGNST